MSRPKKHPDHDLKALLLMNKLLDSLVSLWTSEEEPQLQAIAEELEMSASKVRKLLITAGERDAAVYYQSDMASRVLQLWKEKKTVAEISSITGLSRSSVTGYTPHMKIIYSLDTMSAESERIKLYRERKAAVEQLLSHLDLPDELDYLWKCVITFENYPFTTAGRGKEHKGATKFRYTASREGGAGGRHYSGQSMEGYGNEIWITTSAGEREKSISRSTVDLAYKNARAIQAAEGCVSGPKKLGIPGAGSYLYVMYLRFCIITSE